MFSLMERVPFSARFAQALVDHEAVEDSSRLDLDPVLDERLGAPEATGLAGHRDLRTM
jgi:hypothetical protein